MSDTDRNPPAHGSPDRSPQSPTPTIHSATDPFREDEDLVVAEVVEPWRPLWPALVVAILAIMTAIVVSTIALATAAMVTGNFDALYDLEAQQQWLTDFAGSGIGLLVLVLPGQFVLAAFAIGGAWFSRDYWVDRLGLRAGRLPVWTWMFFLTGSPFVGLIAGELMSLVTDKPSDQLELFDRIFQFDSIGSLVLLLLLIGLLPGIVEEILFRGFLQRRLLKRLPVAVSIGITTLFFAGAHVDSMHVLAVIPLGLWLGVIAWRAESVWPAIFGHVGNNGYAILLSKMMGTEPDWSAAGPMVYGLIGLSLCTFIGSIIALTALVGGRSK